MEKINEIFTNFEKALKKDVKIKSLPEYTQTNDSLNSVINETSKKKNQIIGKIEGKARGVSIEDYVKDTYAEIGSLAEKFAKVIDLTKQLETDEAIKQFLAQKITTIFEGISERAETTFNLSNLELFDAMMGELRGDMEEKLIAGIEQELFSVKTSFGEFEKVYEIMEQQFTGITQAMTDMKDHYQNQMKLLQMTSEIAVRDFPKINDIYQNLNQNFEEIQNEIEKIRTTSQETSVKFLQNLKVETETKIKNLEGKNTDLTTNLSDLEKSKADLKANLEGKNKDLTTQLNNKETELKEVSQFLEKSPKYQILYLINNLGDASMEKLKGLTNIDESIISLALQDLHEKDLITLAGEGEKLSIKIKQKLNPLSYLELPSVFDGETITKFKNYSDLSSFEEGFNQILAQIDEHKEKHREAAGYLVSVLYLYIYESKYLQFYDKIHKNFQKLRKESFYIKLLENALHNNPWESKKKAEIEGMVDPSEVTILNKSLNTLEESSEEYPKTGPFVIEAYKPLSLLVSNEEIIIEKSQLNFFTNIADLLKWVWLNGKGTSFLVKFRDAAGKKSEIIVSATPSIDAQLFVKKFDVRVD